MPKHFSSAYQGRWTLGQPAPVTLRLRLLSGRLSYAGCVPWGRSQDAVHGNDVAFGDPNPTFCPE